MTGRDMICQLLKTKYKYSNIPHTLDHVLEIIAENMNVLDVWKEEQHMIELRDEIKRLERKLKVIKSSPKRSWISVKDRLPEEGDDVLVWFEYYRYGEYNCLYQTHGIGTYFENFKSWLINGETGWRDLRVIAWMPLPEKPESEDDADVCKG